MADKGNYYKDISNEFEVARINYGLFKNDGEKLLQKDFDPTVNPSLINNVAAGRSSNDELRKRIIKFTGKWYWNYKNKSKKVEK